LPDPVCPFEAAPEGLRVALKVVPKAARAGIAGIEADAAGRAVLKVRVTEAPQGGKAVTAGARDRRKTLLVAGDPDALAARLRTWLAELAG
jgi:uncharacterized protein YggU (UPF0235/DUF167 family)